MRDSLCDLRPIEIPRPKFSGMQFISTRGRYGFYQASDVPIILRRFKEVRNLYFLNQFCSLDNLQERCS